MAAFWTALILVGISAISITEASTNFGVCLGMNGDNLPSPTDIIGLYKKYGIGKIRLFEPYPAVLEALRGAQIDLSLGTRNEDTPTLASSPEAAQTWFATNVEPYLDDIVFEYITVGNEIVPGEYSQYIAPAMQNLQQILTARNLAGIKVTTVLAGVALATSYPPSNGAFSDESKAAMISVPQFLSAQGSPLMINVYPYFAYASDPVSIPLQYALFTSTAPVIQDGGLSYYNLFDAIVDAFYSAMEREGFSDVSVVISESGWPSNGNGNYTNPELAATYNKNCMDHVNMHNGTPKRPNKYIEGYMFAMFEENQKPAGVEQHFGLFHPNMEPAYPVFPPPAQH